MKTISLYEAKSQLSSLLREVEKGETVAITRHGKRIAEIIPCTPTKMNKAKRGSAKSPDFYMAADFDAPLDCFAPYMIEGALKP